MAHSSNTLVGFEQPTSSLHSPVAAMLENMLQPVTAIEDRSLFRSFSSSIVSSETIVIFVKGLHIYMPVLCLHKIVYQNSCTLTRMSLRSCLDIWRKHGNWNLYTRVLVWEVELHTILTHTEEESRFS